MPAVPVVEETHPETVEINRAELRREARPPRRGLLRAGRPGLIAFVISAVGVAGVGLLALKTFDGPPDASLAPVGALAGTASGNSPAAAPASAPASAPAAAKPAAVRRAPKNLGTKKGVYTLRGPSTAVPGSWATFVLQGKTTRIVRTDASAPFAAEVDTRKLPNGKYTLRVMVLRVGAPARVGTRTLTVLNPKKKVVKEPAAGGGKPATGSGAGSGSGGGAGSGAATGVAGQVVSLTNAERSKNGCPALTVDSSLTRSAQGHSADMAANGYFAHDSQDGRSPFDRMRAAGYSYRMAAENIAMGQQTAQDVVTAWMNSEGHRANILNCGLTEIGVGYALNASGAPYWTQNFGTPA